MLFTKSLMLAAACLFITGCGGGDAETPPAAETELGDSADFGPAESTIEVVADSGDGSETTAGDSTAFALTPDNTQIQFIGTHNKDEPDPRTCEFTDFIGEATIAADGRVTGISVEIQTNAITTFNDDLTNHLKNEDFLDVRVHETITFEMNSIDVDDDGMTLIGNLTLMGTTNEVSFPADVSVADGQLSLTGSLTILRSEYGMDKKLEDVNDEVQINITVGG